MIRNNSIWFGHMALRDGIMSKMPWRALCALILVWQPHPLVAQAVDPVEQARRNAREGLQAALEELQQAAGPDQRVTARASILDANILRPHLTGVWQSWEIDPINNPPDSGDYTHGRQPKFLKWLVSHQDGEAAATMNFPWATPNNEVVLLGQGTLGGNVQNQGDIVNGDRVPAGDPHGSFAWVVLDEGVKVRINTPYLDKGDNGLGSATKELGSGVRPRTEIINGLANLNQGIFKAQAGPVATSWDLQNGLDADDFVERLQAYSPGIANQLKPLTHDLSYHAMGIFCNVARGGLKKDFQMMTNGSLPAEFAHRKIYQTQLGLSGEPSDPYWQYLADFANLRAQRSSASAPPFVLANVPDGYTPFATGSGTTGNPYQAVVAQPQSGTMLLPTIVRIQFIFGLSTQPSNIESYRLYLTYQPVVTLHNPYNVAMRLQNLAIRFTNLPFAIQCWVNTVDKTNGLLPFDGILRSLFNLIIKSGSGSDIVLNPGEVRIFSPNGTKYDNVYGNKQIDMFPGFDPSSHISVSLKDIELKRPDKIRFLVAPRSSEAMSGNRFVVTMTLGDGRKAGVIVMDYRTPDGIEKAIGGNFPIQIDSLPFDGFPYPVALLSLRARTTSWYEPNPGKPWCFAHARTGVAKHRFDLLHPMDHTHEFDFKQFSMYQSPIYISNIGRNGFFMSGGDSHSRGVSFGALHDIPLAPIQSFSTLNGADPTGVSGYLPRFAQPIGNSWAHPLISMTKLREPNLSGDSDYLDHSFLLNLALYDHFYFSGLANQKNSAWFASPLSSSQLATQFSQGMPLDDPRMLLYRPNGQPAADFVRNLGSDAYRKVPAWQMMQGAFNVNSTSVEAWKAMLASVHDDNAVFVNLGSGQTEPLRDKPPGQARISRFRLPGSESYAGGSASEAYWLGPREYSAEELESLAEKIVAQVRERGPFLSMGDFVNRQLTSGNPEHARCGALQQAIDEADINRALASSAGAGFDITQSRIPISTNYKFPEAALGASYQGAPGCLSQADLLTVLGNAATVRSDTFTIRAYGENRDASGQVIGRAWCEAVVQRVPDWVDPADAADVPPNQLTRETNRTLGRRFRLIAFRWLQPDEV